MANNKNLLFNGEVYIRKFPGYDVDDAFINLKNQDLLIDSTLDGEEITELCQEIDKVKNELRCFYQFYNLFTDGKVYMLKCKGFLSNIKVYFSIDDVRKEFISLREFLEHATYIGRAFKRKKPTKNDLGEYEDESYMYEEYREEPRCIVLYELDNVFLVREQTETGYKYSLLGSRYTYDKNYEFFGEQIESYKNKSKVYQEIFQQVLSSKEIKREI